METITIINQRNLTTNYVDTEIFTRERNPFKRIISSIKKYREEKRKYTFKKVVYNNNYVPREYNYLFNLEPSIYEPILKLLIYNNIFRSHQSGDILWVEILNNNKIKYYYLVREKYEDILKRLN